MFDPSSMAWTNLSTDVLGPQPSPRSGHGFASAAGKLYVHGGYYLFPGEETIFSSLSLHCTQWKHWSVDKHQNGPEDMYCFSTLWCVDTFHQFKSEPCG